MILNTLGGGGVAENNKVRLFSDKFSDRATGTLFSVTGKGRLYFLSFNCGFDKTEDYSEIKLTIDGNVVFHVRKQGSTTISRELYGGVINPKYLVESSTAGVYYHISVGKQTVIYSGKSVAIYTAGGALQEIDAAVPQLWLPELYDYIEFKSGVTFEVIQNNKYTNIDIGYSLDE